MEIRFLADHPEHVPALAEWFQAEWGYFFPDGGGVPFFVERFHAHMSRDALPLALVALDGGGLLGTASLREHDMDSRRELTPWLGGVYVAAEARGRGIGVALVRAVEEMARGRGYREMYLYATDKVPFYEALGWSVHERTTYRGEPVTVMRTEL